MNELDKRLGIASDKALGIMLAAVKRTAGYHESQHKDEVLKGARIALNICAAEAESRILDAQDAEQRAQMKASEAVSDLETVSAIIRKWSGL
jgi:hypothetical protein